jgi:hypothetical protein
MTRKKRLITLRPGGGGAYDEEVSDTGDEVVVDVAVAVGIIVFSICNKKIKTLLFSHSFFVQKELHCLPNDAFNRRVQYNKRLTTNCSN